MERLHWGVYAGARVLLILLFGASAVAGTIAGVRRWAPCHAGFATDACMLNQAFEVEVLPHLARPEAVSLAFLTPAVVVLALSTGLPWIVRLLLVPTAGAHLLEAVEAYRAAVGRAGVSEVPLELSSGLASVQTLLLTLGPLLMMVAAYYLVVGPPRPPGVAPTEVLAGMWVAMALASPMVELFVVMFGVYGSHDAPPGLGLFRSALAGGCALVLVAVHGGLFAGPATTKRPLGSTREAPVACLNTERARRDSNP